MRWRKFLIALNPLYRFAIGAREYIYKRGILRSVHLGPRTISVGNIEVGGTGKSPFVSGLVATIVAKGGRPVVLARGYRSGLHSNAAALFLGGEVLSVKDLRSGLDLTNSQLFADEARMISAQHQSVPVIIGSDRRAAFGVFDAEIDEYHPTHLILDDGFQHWQIARDVDVVLISESLSNESLLPAGNLREPISSLDRSDFIIKVAGRDVMQSTPSKRAVTPERTMDATICYGALTCISGSLVNPSQIPLSAVAICGIARPKPFIDAVRKAGVCPLRVLALSDHQTFSKDDFSSEFLSGADAIITTEKDFWRDPKIFKATNLPVLILPMRIEFTYDLLL